MTAGIVSRLPPETARPEATQSRADRPKGANLWLLAIRPRTLSISVVPVLVGTALAWSEARAFAWQPMLAALLAAMLIQAGTNLYNDVADCLRGGDQPMRQGPARVTAMGWATPASVRRAALAAFALAALLGIYLAAIGGWPILLLGIASMAAGWAYSGGPRPIAYTPLGEIAVVLFFGVGAVAGTVWLHAAALPPSVALTGLIIGLPAAAVLHANNYRDMEADRIAGRRTLAILLGKGPSLILYATLMLVPFAVLSHGPSGGWPAFLALPLALRLVRRFAVETPGPAFNAILAATAKFQLAMGALLAVGLLLR